MREILCKSARGAPVSNSSPFRARAGSLSLIQPPNSFTCACTCALAHSPSLTRERVYIRLAAPAPLLLAARADFHFSAVLCICVAVYVRGKCGCARTSASPVDDCKDFSRLWVYTCTVQNITCTPVDEGMSLG